jgi:hypothetical protein
MAEAQRTNLGSIALILQFFDNYQTAYRHAVLRIYFNVVFE